MAVADEGSRTAQPTALVLAGRVDDAIRTRDNRTVSLPHVASVLRDLDQVTDAVVVSIDTAAGQSFGAVVQCEQSLGEVELRSRIAEVLPPWSRPRVLALVPALPRLPNGKPDRQACATMLSEGTRS
jgi:acyl-coenzyme A synthetase/AMP-(fatty) acid ligase